VKRQSISPFDIKIIKEAALVALAKFRPGHLAHNPVIFLVAMLSFLLPALLVYDSFMQGIDFLLCKLHFGFGRQSTSLILQKRWQKGEERRKLPF